MQYNRPTTLADAFDILKMPGVQMLAGATDVFPATTMPSLTGPVLDLTGIPDLSGISKTDDGWRIGATTTWAQLAKTDLPPGFGALKQAARQIGSPQIQNSATLVGNLCNASPAADGVPPLLVLDAMIEITSKNGLRLVPLSDFILDVRKTALEPGEIVTAILVPDHAAHGTSAFEKLGARKYLVISICMVAARIDVTSGRINAAAISVGACNPVATRLPALEDHLHGKRADDPNQWEAGLPQLVQAALSPIADIRSDAPYRLKAAAELTATAIRRAVAVQSGGA